MSASSLATESCSICQEKIEDGDSAKVRTALMALVQQVLGEMIALL